MYWHIDTDIISLIVILAIYVYTLKTPTRNKTALRSTSFINCLRGGILMTAIDIAASVIMEVPTGRFLYHLMMTLYLMSIDLVIVSWFVFALTILYEDDEQRGRRAHLIVTLPYVAYMILVALNPWTGLFYTLSPDMVYARGAGFLPLTLGVYAVYAIALFVIIMARRKHISSEYPKPVLLMTPILLAISIPAQLLNAGWLMILPAYMICLVLAFLFFQNVRARGEQAQLTQLTELVENFACGLAISNVSADGKLDVQYVSKGFAALCEEDSETLLSRYRADILTGVHPHDREMVRENLQKAVDNLCEQEITFRFITPFGKIKWLRVNTKIACHTDGTATVYATYTNLTEQRVLQNQLSDVVQYVPCGICIYNWDGEDLYPLMVNDRFSEMLGEDALTYLKDVRHLRYTHVHPDDLARLQTESISSLKASRPLNITYRSLNFKTNEYMWVRMRGRVLPQEDGRTLVLVSYNDVTQEHLAEQQLRESERALEYATEQAGLNCWRYDAEHDRAYPDERKQRDFNLPPVLNRFIPDWIERGIIHPNYAHLYRDACLRMKAGEKQAVFEAQSYAADHSLHWYRYCLTNLFGEDGKPTISVCTSLMIDTERELKAKYELEKNRGVVDEDNLLARAVYNLTTGDTIDYTDLRPERGVAFTFGRANANLLIDEEERKRFLQFNDMHALIERFSRGETEHKLEYRRRMLSGVVRWTRSALNVVRDPSTGDIILFEYWYDIEEEKMLKQMYVSLAADNYDFVARIDGQDKHFVVSSKAGLDRVPPNRGANADEVANYLFDDCISAEERETVVHNSLVQNIRQNLKKTGRFQFTYRIRQLDGAIRHKRITQYYIDAQRGIIAVTCEDVTELIAAETEKNGILADALQTAKQASSAKSQFLSRVSHELRTPLNAIIGFIELSKGADMEKIQAYLHNSDIAAKQLLNIINDVLDMSSIESGKLKIARAPFNMKHLIQSITNIYVSQCDQKGLIFDTRITTPIDERLIGDQLRVNQILLNLLNNAVKFTAEGRVLLTISQSVAQNNSVVIRFDVTDTGCGMNEEMASRLFMPFEQESAQTAQKYGGSGLGLFIVSSLVGMMNGVIRVDSHVGEGTVFTVELPFARAEDELNLPMSETVRDLNVLVVDDEQTEREYLTTVIERIGVRHACVSDGEEALSALSRAENAGDMYNVCLIDWRMPNMTGIETTRRIRERYGNSVIVIVVSAYEHYYADENAKQAGANLFIPKPLFQSSLMDLFSSLTGGQICARESTPTPQDFSARRVLLVEDNAMNRMIAEGLIEKLNIQCETAEDGLIALNRFSSVPAGYYDAILMDIQMPNMDGIEATKRIRASAHPDAKTVQIVALTANAFKEDIAKVISAGMNGHVAKPIEPDTLTDALRRAFETNDKTKAKRTVTENEQAE